MSLNSSQTLGVDLSGLTTMPTGEVISILNGFTVEELIQVFNTYPGINQQYGPLYAYAIVESRGASIDGKNVQAAALNKLGIDQRIINQEITQWRSADEFLFVNQVGTIDEEVSDVMGSDLLRIGKNVVMTLSMLIDWWLIYIFTNNLVINDTFKIDQKIRDGFGSIFQEKGLSTQDNVSISTFTEILSDMFMKGGVALTPDISNYLFGQAKSLQSMIDRLFTVSSSTTLNSTTSS